MTYIIASIFCLLLGGLFAQTPKSKYPTTTELFPHITNQSGFDTGIAILPNGKVAIVPPPLVRGFVVKIERDNGTLLLTCPDETGSRCWAIRLNGQADGLVPNRWYLFSKRQLPIGLVDVDPKKINALRQDPVATLPAIDWFNKTGEGRVTPLLLNQFLEHLFDGKMAPKGPGIVPIL